MKTKFTIFLIALTSSLQAFAGEDDVTAVPEPSMLGLFAAAGIAVTLINKFKK